MQHFHAGNLHQIKDAPPNTWATVHASDVVTISELARRGFHLVDMTGELWTMRRAGLSGPLLQTGGRGSASPRSGPRTRPRSTPLPIRISRLPEWFGGLTTPSFSIRSTSEAALL